MRSLKICHQHWVTVKKEKKKKEEKEKTYGIRKKIRLPMGSLMRNSLMRDSLMSPVCSSIVANRRFQGKEGKLT